MASQSDCTPDTLVQSLYIPCEVCGGCGILLENFVFLATIIINLIIIINFPLSTGAGANGSRGPQYQGIASPNRLLNKNTYKYIMYLRINVANCRLINILPIIKLVLTN
jgi:hypothetical protein